MLLLKEKINLAIINDLQLALNLFKISRQFNFLGLARQISQNKRKYQAYIKDVLKEYIETRGTIPLKDSILLKLVEKSTLKPVFLLKPGLRSLDS